jgi:1-acyl-sn-glycerol-3-phosphate acyltransferase
MRRFAEEAFRLASTALGWAAFVGLVLVWAIAVIPATLLLTPLLPSVRERFVSLTSATLGAFVRGLPFLALRVDGSAKRLEGARILVANHQSRLDTPVMIALEPGLVGPVRGYMLRVPVVGTVIRLLGFFDTDASARATLEAIDGAVLSALERGGALLFYPEGTRSRTGEIGPFRLGAFHTAVTHALPIQAVVIEGLDAVFPPGHFTVQTRGRHVARIRYLEPLRPPFGVGRRRDVARALAERLRGMMIDELARLRSERSGRQA